MIQVTFPEPSYFRIKTEKGKDFIFDTIRKQWLVLTPEEWVRQNFVSYLINEMQYPAGMIALEKEIRLGELKKRFDILIYDPAHQPWMMIECKAPEIALSQDVLSQLLRYQLSTPVSYLVITNGNHTLGWQKAESQLAELQVLPLHGQPI